VTDTLTIVFIGAALLCVVAGVAAVRRTQRRLRDADGEYSEDGEDDGGATYAEEAAAVSAAEAAATAAAQERDDEIDGIPTP